MTAMTWQDEGHVQIARKRLQECEDRVGRREISPVGRRGINNQVPPDKVTPLHVPIG
jgi:hypothetical protein